MLSRSIPNTTQDDIKTYGSVISETYKRLESQQASGLPLSADQLYILSLTRFLAHMQREFKELTETLESRHGLR